MLKKIAVIPARGGSKRIPKKNIMDFNGKPMIAWTIKAALESECFDRIIVSTDDDEIAKISVENGAEVPFLREKFSDDITPVSTATISAITQAKKYWGEDYDIAVQLMANCPLRSHKVITDFMQKFLESEYDSLLSCFKFGWMNPWWALKKDGNNFNFLFPDVERNKRSQDLDSLWCPTGSIWIANTEILLSAGSFYCPNMSFSEIDLLSAVDIDDYDDFKFAIALSKME